MAPNAMPEIAQQIKGINLLDLERLQLINWHLPINFGRCPQTRFARMV